MTSNILKTIRRRLSSLSESPSSEKDPESGPNQEEEEGENKSSIINCEINLNYIASQEKEFYIGDNVSGIMELSLPIKTSLDDISLTLECMGEVRWMEYHGVPQSISGHVFYDNYHFLKAKIDFEEDKIETVENLAENSKLMKIPFNYILPNDQNLPSSMISNNGFIQYTLKVEVKMPQEEEKEEEVEVKKFLKEIIVQAPIEKDLLIPISCSTNKSVLLHNGTVSLEASLSRRGFFPGEPIPVHLSLQNTTNTAITPKISLKQIQIFKCGESTKTFETTLNEEWIIGPEIPPNSDADEVLNIQIAQDESLSIKTLLITIQYSIVVLIDIPHAFDLSAELPFFVTGARVLENLKEKNPNFFKNESTIFDNKGRKTIDGLIDDNLKDINSINEKISAVELSDTESIATEPLTSDTMSSAQIKDLPVD